MRQVTSISIAAAAFAASAAICILATDASAATKLQRHHFHRNVMVYGDRPPLTVNRRSWLDPGPAVPVGSMESYVTETTGFNQTPDQAYFPSRFHEDDLPRPLYPTGRPEPLVEFWTPAYPY